MGPDDDMFPEDPKVVLAEGRANPGEVLLGTNSHEWDLFLVLGVADSPKTVPLLHATEISYVFGIQNAKLAPGFTPELSQQVQRYWTRFATTGDPSDETDPTWSPFTTDSDVYQLINEPAPMGGTGLGKDTCDFWDELLAPAAQSPRDRWSPGCEHLGNPPLPTPPGCQCYNPPHLGGG